MLKRFFEASITCYMSLKGPKQYTINEHILVRLPFILTILNHSGETLLRNKYFKLQSCKRLTRLKCHSMLHTKYSYKKQAIFFFPETLKSCQLVNCI